MWVMILEKETSIQLHFMYIQWNLTFSKQLILFPSLLWPPPAGEDKVGQERLSVAPSHKPSGMQFDNTF